MKSLRSTKSIAHLFVAFMVICCALLAGALTAQAVPSSPTVTVILVSETGTPDYTLENITMSKENGGEYYYPQKAVVGGNPVFSQVDAGTYDLTIWSPNYKYYHKKIRVSDSSLTITAELIPANSDEPYSLTFADQDNIPGKISGRLQWEYPGGAIESMPFTHYQVYFADSSGNRLPGVPPVAQRGKGDTTVIIEAWEYVYDLESPVDIPAAAERLQIYEFNANVPTSDPLAYRKTSAFVELLDNPSDFPGNLRMTDSNPAPGVLQATIQWDKIPNESKISGYVLYAEGEEFFEEIGYVAAAGQPGYSVNMSELQYEGNRLPQIFMATANQQNILSEDMFLLTVVDNTSGRTSYTPDRDAEMDVPADVRMHITDAGPNQIGGVLTWSYPAYIGSFEICLLDQNNAVLQTLYSINFSNFGDTGWGSEITRTFRIPDGTNLPAGTKKIGVAALDYFGGLSMQGTASIGTKLSSITFDPAVSLSPSFSSSILNYQASVANSVYSIAITAAPQDANASLTINGIAASSGAAVTVNLNQGVNVIPVTVTAEDNTTTQTYNLVVARSAPVSSNTQLSSLSLGQGYSLNPSFSKDITSYTAVVDGSAASVSVTAAVYDSLSKVSFTSAGLAAPQAPASSVTESVSLNSNATEIFATVTAESGAQTVYKITVQPVRLSISGGIGGVNGTRIEGIANGTTAGALLSSLDLQSGVTAKVVDKTSGTTIGDLAVLSSSMKLVLMYGTGSTFSYELKTLADTLQEWTGVAPGQPVKVNQLLQLITSPNKIDLTGDGVFNGADVRKVLLEITPVN